MGGCRFFLWPVSRPKQQEKVQGGPQARATDLQDLSEQMDRAYEERNIKLADELLQKIDTMGKTLGPEYVTLIDRLELLDPENNKLGAEIMFELAALNRLCTRQPFETP